MISSPPQEAEHIRGKTLTPESPKPVHYPSPSNIPILEKSMDPHFHESLGTPASFQSFTHPTQTPSAQSSSSLYPDQQNAQAYNGARTGGGAVGPGPGDYTQSASYGNGYGSSTQDTQIQTFPSQNQALAPSYSSEANSTATQENRSSSYPMPYDPNAYPANQPQAQPAQLGQYQLPSNFDANNNVYQSLLDSLSTSNGNNSSNNRNASPLPLQPPQAQGTVATISSLPSAPNLPPRPPMQDKPVTHPNYSADDDIRSYHPHSQKQSNPQYRGPGQLQPLNVQTATSDNAYSPSTARPNQTPSTPSYRQRESVDLRVEDDEDARWPPEINKLYEEFLEDERKFVTDGQWDQFPMGSRLFIGKFIGPSSISRPETHVAQEISPPKRSLNGISSTGSIAMGNLHRSQSSRRMVLSSSWMLALASVHYKLSRARRSVEGRCVSFCLYLALEAQLMVTDLEISKPQRNTKKADAGDRNGARRRSRSPDYTRGGTGSQGGRGVDRYTSNAISPRDRDYRRSRDDYRPNRSPSPRGGRGRRDRSRDRYDARRRSRSRSPLGRGGGRYRASPTPRDDVDDLPLPHREPHQVPDVQVIAVDHIHRYVCSPPPRDITNEFSDYIAWVEDSFRKQGLRIDVLILSPRLSEHAVIRRQILEGVLAIVKLNGEAVAKNRVSLQVFDRRAGAGNVQFEGSSSLSPIVFLLQSVLMISRICRSGASNRRFTGLEQETEPSSTSTATRSCSCSLWTRVWHGSAAGTVLCWSSTSSISLPTRLY